MGILHSKGQSTFRGGVSEQNVEAS